MWRLRTAGADRRGVRAPDDLRDALQTFGRRRRRVATAWRLINDEARAGLRRWPGTDIGERYGRALAHFGEGRADTPDAHERRLADVVDPTRPGSVTDMVNAASREVRVDAADWSLSRLWSLVRQMASESAEERAGRELEDGM